MAKFTFEEFLKAVTERRDEAIAYAVKQIETMVYPEEPLRQACLHYFKAPGKGLRPAMLILTAQAYGASADDALPTAAALEMVHTMSLIHDDIMDNDLIRRGQPAVHAKWDNNVAILAGDCMLALAFRLIQNTKTTDQIRTWLTKRFTEAFVLLCEGQQKDILFTDIDPMSLTVQDVFDMQLKKTGELFLSAVQAGVVIGTQDPMTPELEPLSTYAEKAGTAFQIQDDLLGLLQDTDKMGKPQGSDIREGKRTLIAIHAFMNATPEQKEILLKAFGKPRAKREDIEQFMKTINEIGSIDYAKSLAKQLAEEAIEALDKASLSSPYREMLETFAEFLVNREY